MATANPAFPLIRFARWISEPFRRHLARLRLWLSWLRSAEEPEVLSEAINFQTDLEEIVLAPPPPHLRFTNYTLVVMLVTLLTIAGVVEVDSVVSSSGRLTADAPPIVLQPIDRGIIRELKARAGDVVTKGQVLATLDPTFAQADMASLSSQQRSSLAQLRRIEAELNHTPFNPGNTLNPDESLQASLYGQRQAQYNSRLRALDEEIQRLEASSRTIENERASLEKQVVVAKELEAMRASLFKSQNGSKLNLLDAQTYRMRAERDQQDAEDHQAELRHSLAAKRAERQAFVDEWRRQLFDDLVRVRAEAARIDESLSKATLVRDLVVVTAPQDGVVLEVAKRSVGSVIQGGEALFTLVPTEAPLIAEIMIGSADVGNVKAGDEVLIKVEAFPYLRHGSLEGRLRSVSEESFDANGNAPLHGAGMGAAFHRGQVELTKTDLVHLPEGAKLIPGMTVGAEIKVGRHSVLAFFLYPIRASLSSGLRER